MPTLKKLTSQELLLYLLIRKKVNTVHKYNCLFSLHTPTRLSLTRPFKCQNSFHSNKIRWSIVQILHTQARSSTIGNYCTVKENAAVYLPSGILGLLLLLCSWTQFFSSMLTIISKSQFRFPGLLITSLSTVALLVSLSFINCS